MVVYMAAVKGRTICFVLPKWSFAETKCKNMLNITSQLRCYASMDSGHVSLTEIGRLCEPKVEGRYSSGEIFLHKKFDYRGAILFSWPVRVFDNDAGNSKQDSVSSLAEASLRTYYQVIIDSRDLEHTKKRKVNDDVTLLHENSDQEGRCLLKIPGLDYVAHDDILPFVTKDKRPILHTLFDEFFTYKESETPHFIPTVKLKQFHEIGHPWLEMDKVYKETTEDVCVTVIPFYLGTKKIRQSSYWWWRYCIRVENLGIESIVLHGTQWKLYNKMGTPALENIVKRKVVGKEPCLNKQMPAFQFSSHVSLEAPCGSMWGSFTAVRECNGDRVDLKIPAFDLESSPYDLDVS